MDRLCPVAGFYLMFRAISEQRGFLHFALILVMSLLKENRKIDLSLFELPKYLLKTRFLM